jgi:hypothetical protein
MQALQLFQWCDAHLRATTYELVEVCPQDPHLFWSAIKTGTVWQYNTAFVASVPICCLLLLLVLLLLVTFT